jgi:hypothetical protein
MLLAVPDIEDFYKRCCDLSNDEYSFKDGRYEHPSKLIQFLVGNKGKHDVCVKLLSNEKRKKTFDDC